MILYLMCLIPIAGALPPHGSAEIGLPADEPDSVEEPPFSDLQTERFLANDIDITRTLDEEERQVEDISRHLQKTQSRENMENKGRQLKIRMDEGSDKRSDRLSRLDKKNEGDDKRGEKWSRLGKENNERGLFDEEDEGDDKRGERWSRLGKKNNERGLFNKGDDKRGAAVAREEMKSSRSLESRAYKRTTEGADARMKQCRLSSEEKLEALNVHRRFRESEHASNMWQMYWDDSLADLAQGLADQCVFKHSNLYFPNGTRVGQNLGAITGANNSISRVVQLFVEEKSDYDFQNHQWSNVVGHYLQVVFWQSLLVGCARNFCPQLKIETDTVSETWYNAVYWTCNYWPPVSYKLRPFGDGDKCTRCVVPKGKGLGVKCVDGTCQDCKMDGSDSECRDSVDPIVFAKPDKDPMCLHAKVMGWCKKYYAWSKANCQKACGFCDLIPQKLELED